MPWIVPDSNDNSKMHRSEFWHTHHLNSRLICDNNYVLHEPSASLHEFTNSQRRIDIRLPDPKEIHQEVHSVFSELTISPRDNLPADLRISLGQRFLAIERQLLARAHELRKDQSYLSAVLACSGLLIRVQS